jgi:hypothetical protein
MLSKEPEANDNQQRSPSQKTLKQMTITNYRNQLIVKKSQLLQSFEDKMEVDQKLQEVSSTAPSEHPSTEPSSES